MSRPEFREPPKSLYDRLLEFLGELLNDTLGALFSGGRDAVLGWVLLAGFLAAMVVVWVRFAPSLRRDPLAGDEESDLERSRPSVDWLAEAARLAAGGRWRDALRCRYRALVAALAERGVIDEVPGRTAGEYRNDVFFAAPDVSEDFSHASDLFELVWYGDRPTDADQHEQFANLTERVLAGARR